MLETVSLKDFVTEERILILKQLGYETDGKHVLNEKKEILMDEYSDCPVTIENMLLLPGSLKIIDNNPLSIASYLEDHPDAF